MLDKILQKDIQVKETFFEKFNRETIKENLDEYEKDKKISFLTAIPLLDISKVEFQKRYELANIETNENLQNYMLFQNIYVIQSKKTSKKILLVRSLEDIDLDLICDIDFDSIFLASERTIDIFISTKKGILQSINQDIGAIAFLEELFDLAKVKNASDIYISQRGHKVSIRFRTSSEVFEIANYGLKESLIIRNTIEVMSGVENKTSDYDSKIIVNNREYRVNFWESVSGYRFTIRSYSSDFNSETTLKDLGYTKRFIDIITSISEANNGMFLFTAQTGQGKTTTQNVILENLSQEGLEVVSVEDVVERKILSIDQIDLQVYETADEKHKITQQGAVKLFLRARPDVINVGEIRDTDQAIQAYKSAVTGHLVFGSLHVSSTITAMNRMIIDSEMGEENIKSSVRGILYQQLTRKLCDKCKIKLENNKYRANIEEGCDLCNKGFSKHETPISEIAEYPSFKEYDLKNTNSYENYISLEDSAKEKYEIGVIDELHYLTIKNARRKPNNIDIKEYYQKTYNIEIKEDIDTEEEYVEDIDTEEEYVEDIDTEEVEIKE